MVRTVFPHLRAPIWAARIVGRVVARLVAGEGTLWERGLVCRFISRHGERKANVGRGHYSECTHEGKHLHAADSSRGSGSHKFPADTPPRSPAELSAHTDCHALVSAVGLRGILSPPCSHSLACCASRLTHMRCRICSSPFPVTALVLEAPTYGAGSRSRG